jgi:alanine dehydrogenase
MTQPIWLSEADVVSLMDMGEAIDALEKGLAAEASGNAANMVKTHATWGDGDTLHAIGATFPTAGFIGTKTWAHTEGGAAPLLILFDSHNGGVKAIIEAFALGQLRTGGISGVATRWLAAPGADELAIVGTGKQAITQVAAVAAVRPLKRVRVYSPNAEHRASFVKKLQAEEFGFAVTEAESVEAAVKDAPIATLVTRATQPFLRADMLARGAHLNAVGAIVPSRVEFTQDVFARCGRIAVDSVAQVQKLSREFMDQFGTDKSRWEQVLPLSQLVARGEPRPANTDLTLFKAMGMGISDLSLGIELYNRAMAQGVGRSFAPATRAKPQLKAKRPSESAQRANARR